MAEITIRCSHCKSALRIEEAYIGATVECPLCNKEFVVQQNAETQIKKQPIPPMQNTPKQKWKSKYNAKELDTARETITKIFKKTVLASDTAVKSFQMIQENDLDYLDNLDVLPRYGKKMSQLVAESQTLYAPAFDNNVKNFEFEFAFYVCDNIKQAYIYSQEKVTKLFIFENQLFVFSAIWDYSIGKLFAESTKAFFFKDITDISTQSNYEVEIVKQKRRLPHIIIWIVSAILTIATIAIAVVKNDMEDADFFVFVGAICFLPAWIIFAYSVVSIFRFKKVKKLIKKSETFSIMASSGRNFEMTIMCDEWLTANNGTLVRRSNGEQVIQAIRKMIEEKKAEANA